MKCLILAGGRGERLWPLSRKNFPKQFTRIQRNHSLFQETVARNMAYCDEFIIVTSYSYRDIIANQMEVFRGVPYHCVFEEESRNTTAAIVLACMDLQPSEYVFVVAADHLIGSSGYKETILKGKEKAREGKITLFGKKTDEIDSRFGYISGEKFYEKPDEMTKDILRKEKTFQNIGLILSQNGTFLNEIRRLQERIYNQCRDAYKKRERISDSILYSSAVLEEITPVSIEKCVLEKTNKLCCVEIDFSWDDIGSLEDLEKTQFKPNGSGIVNDCKNSTILNQSPNQMVVVNGIDDVLVVNTIDAVYVGRNGRSYLLKKILHENPELHSFSEKGPVIYRQWGYREILVEEKTYRIQRVTILPGRTIYEHRHEDRIENWTILQGSALIALNGISKVYHETDSIEVKENILHQISNNGEIDLVFIETAIGEVLRTDMISRRKDLVTESTLGLKIDPMVKLTPAYKDYLWGGTKLRDRYGKQCDYDPVAESWELSAHPAGNSIISSGKHKGLSFSKYLDIVGKEVLGWKCTPLQSFPLLVKFIDAGQNLSVQVHPNDEFALENENEYGKNELWYVIDSEPGSCLYVGFNRDVSREEVERRVGNNTILDIMTFYPTKPGDVFFIPAGTVHAIGKGNLICEIQQSSNSTYRLYDYGRRDRFGNLREIHLEKALSVLNYKKYEPADFEVSQENGQKTIRCKYFETTILSVNGHDKIHIEDDSFRSIVCIDGVALLSIDKEEEKLNAGESVFVSATNKIMTITGKATLVITRV